MADAQVDLSKLKVPELKKLLKDKGLPTSGNKSDLIRRLKQEMPEAADGTDTIEGELDDSVLNESLEESSQEDEKENNTAEPDNEEITTKDVEQAEEKETSPKTTVVKLGGLSEAERLAQRAKKFGAISEDVRKQTRAERFGVTADDDKKKSRAQRFGLVETADKATSANNLTKNKATNGNIVDKEAEVEKLKQRAERFGTVTSKTLSKVEGNDKLKKRAERFGVVSPSSTTASATTKVSPTSTTASATTKGDADEKLLKRKQRFGTPITAPGPEDETKKTKRSERFNLITPP